MVRTLSKDRRLPPIPEDHLVSPLEGRIVSGVLPRDKEPPRTFKRPGRVNGTRPLRVTYRPMFEREYEQRKLSGLERQGWAVDV